MIHVCKVDPTYFAALLDGTKPFEVRKEAEGEEPFCVGDYLAVNEYSRGDHVKTHYSGRCLLFRITCVLRGYELLQPGAVVLGLRLMPLSFEDFRVLES